MYVLFEIVFAVFDYYCLVKLVSVDSLMGRFVTETIRTCTMFAFHIIGCIKVQRDTYASCIKFPGN
jgi:hypothetical protein